MDKIKKRLAATLLSVSAVGLCAAGVGFAGDRMLSARAAEWEEIELKEEYVYGAQLDVPLRNITVEGETKTATSVLYSPSGNASLLTQTSLDEAGVWTLSYTAKVGGAVYRQDESFEVYDSIARVGNASSFVYGAYNDTEVTGRRIGLASGEKVEFSSIIDLRNAKKDEPIVEMFVTPQTIGELDFKQINLIFTDAEDPDCYLTVRGRQSEDGMQSPNTYWLAGGNNQPLAGWESGWNKLHVNNEWGAPTRHSFYGYYPDDPSISPEQVRISIRYDAETRCVYSGDTMIIDLDSSLYFSKLWNGFTSGRVRLTLSADIYSSSSAEFMVTYLKGVDLSSDKLIDTNAPEITIDTAYDVAPVAKVGTEYPIPDATAKDDYSGACRVERQVWYNFNSINAVTVASKDGCFIPDREGLYAVVYNASDRMGNKAQKIVWVRAQSEIDPIQLNFTGSYATETPVGKTVELADYTAVGGSGKVDVSCEVTLNGQTIDCTKEFRPREAGNYTVKYIARDYIGQTAELTYEIEATPNDKPVFTEEPVLPRYYISGSEYPVPELYAYDYADGSERIVKASVSVIDANGATPRSVEGKFTPLVINNGDQITVIFQVGETEITRQVTAIKSFEADGGRMRLQMQNYFVTKGAAVTANDESITVTSNDGRQSSFEFANALLAEGVSLRFNAVPKQSLFDGIKVTLTDSVDATQSVSVRILQNGAAATMSHGDMLTDLSAGFKSSSASNTFMVTYSKNSILLNTASSDVKSYDDGRQFNGFGSGFVYLTVSFINAQTDSAIDVTDVNGQPVSNSATDRIKPKIALIGSFGGVATLNSTQIVPRALAGDVLDPNVSLTLTVSDRSGNAVKSQDGIVLQNVSADREYSFVASEYNQYSVTYTACDTFNGKDYAFSYVIDVEDREKPVIEFASDIAKTVKLGELIVIPDFTVTDNVTDSNKLTVAKYVCTPTGNIMSIPEKSNAFRPATAGVYEIRIAVTDEAGNMSLIRLSVTVTE